MKTVHHNSQSNNATIQVSSRFNCLPPDDIIITPEHGVTQYSISGNNRAVMSTPAGLVYRNYLFDDGRDKNKQIDMTDNLLKYLKTLDPTITWKMENGYLLFDNDDEVNKINHKLISNPIFINEARKQIQVGSHCNLGIVINNIRYNHTINHVYCCSKLKNLKLSKSYLLNGLLEIFLEAVYENTLFIACLNNIKANENKPCYLIPLTEYYDHLITDYQIIRAIKRACNIIAQNGLSIDVKIAHTGLIPEDYLSLPQNYPLNNIKLPSIWNNPEWIKKVT